MIGQRSISGRKRVRVFLDLFQAQDSVLVLINPDPDSMASSMAVKRLLWKRVKKISIAYIGEVQRLQNQTMVDLLKIPMAKIADVDVNTFTRYVLVDSQPNHAEAFGGFTYDAIIDHHPIGKAWDARYVDIRPDYGATASMLVEYLRGADIKPSSNLATALLYAIKTDTANFERHATEGDVKQFRYAFQHANMNLLRKIEYSDLRESDLRYFQTALRKRVVVNGKAHAHLGAVPNPDICVQIADFFMRVYNIEWSFVSGVHKDKLIVIIRNDGQRKNAEKLADKAFGSFGSAGGHKGAARAELPLRSLRKAGGAVNALHLEAFVRKQLGF